MATQDAFDERRRGLEEEYFRRKEQELIDKLHAAAAQASQLQGLAEASGIGNEEILSALHDLGYTRETVSLLHLVPLVQVAWASGSVTPRERELVLYLSAAQGVAQDSSAWRQLNHWLDKRPSEQFFLTTLRVIRHILDADETAPEHKPQRSNLISYCRRVAQASRDFLGLGSKISASEQQALDQIVEELTNHYPEAVQQVLEKASTAPEIKPTTES